MKRFSIKRTHLNFDSVPEELINSISTLFNAIKPVGILSKEIALDNHSIKFNNYRYRVGNKSQNNSYKIFKDVEIDTEYFQFEDVQMFINFHVEYSCYGLGLIRKEYIRVEFSSLSQKVKSEQFQYIVTPKREIKNNDCDYLVNPRFLFEINEENKKYIKSFLKDANKCDRKYKLNKRFADKYDLNKPNMNINTAC